MSASATPGPTDGADLDAASLGAAPSPGLPAAAGQPLCAADALSDGGKGVRFAVLAGGYPATGFAVRYQGQAYAYLNRCAHVPIELDWAEGEFFESSGLYLMCATHGALYRPESGACAGGPCKGGRLRPIAVIEHAQQLFWQPDDYVQPPQKLDLPPQF